MIDHFYTISQKLDSVRQDTLIDRFDISINWAVRKELQVDSGQAYSSKSEPKGILRSDFGKADSGETGERQVRQTRVR